MKSIIVKLLLIGIVLNFCSCREQIIHNLSEPEANKLITKLYNSSVKPNKIKQPDGNWSIAVPKSESLKAISLLTDNRVFRNIDTNSHKNSNFLSSKMEQKLSYEISLSGILEKTFKSIEGVLEAHVHLNLSNKSDFWSLNPELVKSDSASVLLIVDKNFNITQEEIQKILSGASGIEAEKVSVVINFPQIVNTSMNFEDFEEVEISNVAETTLPRINIKNQEKENIINEKLGYLSLTVILILLIVVIVKLVLRKKKKLKVFKNLVELAN